MQRFRLLPAVITISIVSSTAIAQSNDTPAQAAARAALLQQMNQMDTEQGSSNSMTTPPSAPMNPPPATQSPAAQPPANQPPITQPTPQFSTNVPVMAPPESSPPEMSEPTGISKPNGAPETGAPVSAQQKAQANTTPISVPPPSVLTNDAAQYPVNPPLAPLPPPQGGDTSMPSPTPAIEDQTQTHPVAVPASASGGAWPTPAPANPAAQQLTPGMAPAPAGPAGASLSRETQGTNAMPQDAPINAPPLPISQEKQSELQTLLQRYMANQITPVQYQEERARIMAEP